MANDRMKSVSREIQKLLSEFLREEVKNPRAQLMCSITNLEVSKDLRNAKVFVSFMEGDDKEQLKAIRALQKAAPFFHRRLLQEMSMKRVPLLRFVNDHSIEQGVEICALLDEVKKQDEAALIALGEKVAEESDD